MESEKRSCWAWKPACLITSAMPAISVRPGSKDRSARSNAKLTVAASTPEAWASVFSSRVAQAAQVIPSIFMFAVSIFSA